MTRLSDLDPEHAQHRPAELMRSDRIMYVLGGIALGLAWSYVGRRHRLSMNWMLIPRLAIGYVTAVAAHEAGHAVAAALQRFRILSFVVWPVRFYRHSSEWHVDWASRSGPNGSVGITPRDTNHLRMRQIVVVAAGPLASLGAAAGCWIALNAAETPKWAVDQLLIVALWSAVMAAGSLLPIRRGSASSDAERLRILMRGGVEWERASAQQAIAIAAMNGARPREWSEELIEKAAGLEDGSADARLGRVMRYNWLLDSGRIDEAEQQLVSLLLQPCPEDVSREWMLQAVWFAAMFRRDAGTARKWLAAGRGSGAAAGCNEVMAETALAFVEKRWADVRRLVPETWHSCDRNMDRGTAKAVRDALARVAPYAVP